MRNFFIFKLFDRIPNAILNFITIVSGIISIGAFLYDFVGMFLPLEEIELVKIIEYVADYFVVVYAFTIVLLVYKCTIYYSEADIRLKRFPTEFHRLTHVYRDLDQVVRTGLENHTLNDALVFTRVQAFCADALDSLCYLLTHICNEEVYGCVKLVDAPEDCTPRTIIDQTVTDFVRSNNTPKSRHSSRPKSVLIRENTDFLELMDYNSIRNQFYQSDLLEYSKKLREDDHEYKNSTPNWSDKYRSTVVVPIQVENYLLANKEEDAYHVIGFLCLDANRAGAFSEKNKEPIIQLVKAYADLMYSALMLFSVAMWAVMDGDYLHIYLKNKYNSYYETDDPNDSETEEIQETYAMVTEE